MKIQAFLVISVFIVSCVFVPVISSERPVKEYPNYSKDLLDLINQYRIGNRLYALYYDKKLAAFAEDHSTYMYRRNVLNHDNFHERFVQSGSDLCVENVGWNYSTPGDVFNSWRKSDEHNKNMLDRNIRKAGISKVGAYVTFIACS
ncbi:MAG: CAP domain-containing protein [Nitrospirae bacterium]|nr:CAP domain-containing protein [Nitrospirota bacterium]